MSKRRTRQQKVNARRPVYQLPAEEPVTTGALRLGRKSRISPASVVTMGYDSRLLQKDIFKTLLVSAAILALELGIYFYWS